MVARLQDSDGYLDTRGASAQIFRNILAMAIIILGIWVAPVLADPIVVALAVWSLRGDRQVVQSLTLATVITSLSPAIYAGHESLRLLVVLCAAAGVMNRLGPHRAMRIVSDSRLGLAVLLFAPSVILSEYPMLASGKLVAFTAGAFVFVAVFTGASAPGVRWLTAWMISTFWFVAIASMPLVVSDMGYLVNGRGFQGIIRHPQKLAIFLAPYVAFFVLAWLGRIKVPLGRLAIVVSAALLVLTQGRGATLAALLGIVVAILIPQVNSRVHAVDRRRLAVAAVGIASLALVVAVVGFADSVADFVEKPRRTESSTLVYSVRGRLEIAQDSLERFADSPFVGHGIGVAAEVDPKTVTTIMGIPVSAPVESGNIITGLLEQAGLLGLVGAALFVAQWTKPVFRNGPVIAIGLAVSALFTNISEATFVSFGGSGGFVWLALGWSVALATSVRVTFQGQFRSET